MKLRDVNLQVSEVYEKKLFHTFYFMHFAFIFLESITIISFEEALKVCEHNFIQEILAKSKVTCNLPVQLRFIQVNFIHVEFVI